MTCERCTSLESQLMEAQCYPMRSAPKGMPQEYVDRAADLIIDELESVFVTSLDSTVERLRAVFKTIIYQSSCL